MSAAPLSPGALADRYVHELGRIVSVAELMEIRRRNTLVSDPGSRCASHDFRDADAIMARAFAALADRAPDASDAEDRAHIAGAWQIVVTELLNERLPG